MTFLPIVERELRVAARRRITFQIRFAGAVAATLLGGLYLAGSQLPGGLAPTGRSLFSLLIGLEFTFALLTGPFLTADCLSRERREGTLGFLFLTDLTGLDVVAGKFAALGLVPLHGLLAVFPVAALTVFLGGVTPAEFWRGHLVILNTAFLSLAAGLWISSVVNEERQAVVVTLGVLTGLVFAPLIAHRLILLTPFASHAAPILFASPLFGGLGLAFPTSTGSSPPGFGAALAIQHALGWLFLLLAATLVHSTWRSDPLTRPAVAPPASGKSAPGPSRPRLARVAAARDRRIHQSGPMSRLAWQSRGVRVAIPWLTAITALAALGTFGLELRTVSATTAADHAGRVIAGGLHLLKLVLIIHSVYFLQDLCRTGTMELILTTPVSSHTLGSGHLAALREMFTRPLLALGVLQIALSLAGRLITGGDWPSRTTLVVVAVGPPLFGVFTHFADFVALAYHASTHALRYDRPVKAIARSLILVLALPALLCGQARLVVDLLVIGQLAPGLERFRELARGWHFPGWSGSNYGPVRPL